MYHIIHTTHGCGQWISGIIIGCCGFIGGLSLVWAAIFYPKLKQGEIKLKITKVEESFVASFIHIGQVIGTIMACFILDRVGRRGALLITINFNLLAWILIYFLHELWAILLARIMTGIWLGIVVCCCPPYMSETASPSVRGRITALLTVLAMVGAVFQTTVGVHISYNNVALLSFIFTVLQLLCLANIPESVYSLLGRDNEEKAERNLKWLRGRQDVSSELEKIKHHLTIQMSRKHGFIDVFKWPASRKGFIQAANLVLVQRFSGFQALLSFASIILPDSWIDAHQYPMVWNTINLIFLILSFCCVDYVDRKVLLLISCIGTSIFSSIISLWFFLHEKTNIDMSKTLWLPMLALSINTAFYATGLLYIPIVFQGEIFPMNIKSKASSMIAFIGFATSMFVVQIFIPLKLYLGMFSNFLMYAISSAVGCFIVIRLVETRGKTLERIQIILEGKPNELSYPNVRNL